MSAALVWTAILFLVIIIVSVFIQRWRECRQEAACLEAKFQHELEMARLEQEERWLEVAEREVEIRDRD